VLELGCASGGNLIPMAEVLPNARFVGVDFSARQVEQGHEIIRSLGLANIELMHRDIGTLDASMGKFDYIICHGVFSWVPAPVQDRILLACRELLAAQGVAYISYNTYPGWHLRASVREMMKYHAGHFDDAKSRIDQSRALLDFLAKAAPADGGAYGRLLHDELQMLRGTSDSYLYHEHLEEHNEPTYFYRFMERAGAAGLRYLGESSLEVMLPFGFSDEIQQTLRGLTSDIIRMEQYLDFLRNRMFRCTLLCHQEVALKRELQADLIKSYYASSVLAPEGPAPDVRQAGGLLFRHPGGGTAVVRDATDKAVLISLYKASPESLSIAEIAARAAAELGGQLPAGTDIVAAARAIVLKCCTSGLLDLRLDPDRYVLRVSAQPRTTAMVRYQASRGRMVTNLRHESLQLEHIDTVVLPYLDGSRDHAALAEVLAQAVIAGSLDMHRNSVRLSNAADIRAASAEGIEVVLERLARKMLLAA
jgi:methyltransferase-like protein/SAM-dependent methyltransferase